MIWLLTFGVIFAAIVLAGRAHSRHLDRLQARAEFFIAPLSVEPGEGFGAAQVLKGQAPVAIFAGERTLICSVPADQASAFFDSSDGAQTFAARTEASLPPDALSPPGRRKAGRRYPLKTSRGAG